jgi:predicted extracellular nuclease/methionine-rich copper-binding protein CopC
MKFKSTLTSLFSALFSIIALTSTHAQLSLTTIGTPVTQNFDTLATSGTAVWTDNSTLTNWYAARQTAGVLNIAAGTGSINTGQLYSFGTGTLTERALGSVSSGTPSTIYFAVRLANATGVPLTSLTVEYVCEQWRNGGNATQQNFAFEYQIQSAGTITGANSPATGWLAASAFNCAGPIATTTQSALDGNAAANRVAVTGSLPVSMPVGSEIWLRWVDLNDAGFDHGFGIDDLSITPNGVAVNAAPTVSTVSPADAATNVAQNASLSVSFSESVNLAANAVTLECPTGTTIALTSNTVNPNTTFTFTPNAPLPASTTCSVRVVAANVTESAATALPMAADFISGFSTAAPGDTAPSVTSTTPASGATGIDPAATITLNFSELVNVATGGVTLECPSGSAIALTGLPANNVSSLVLTPATPLPLGTTCTVTALAASVSDVDANDPPDNLAANVVFAFATRAITPINQIQGNATASALVGQTVSTRGVVTATYPGFRGFYIQTPDANVDADPATSEGIFVFVDSAILPTAAVVGNLVEVTGLVGEFDTATQLGSGSAVPTVTQISTGNPLPAPISVALPLASASALEPLEGMRVSFAQTLTASGNFTLGRFGEVVLSSNGRLFNPSNVVDLNDATASGNTIAGNSNLAAITAAIDANRLNQITLDDTTSLQNVDPVPFALSASNTLRAGSSVSGLTGIVNQITRGYRILSDPSDLPNFNRAPRPLTPPAVGGTLKAAGFNVLNYFNGNGSNVDLAAGGFPTARGASNLPEFNRQRAKVIAAIDQLTADVVGVIEMENDGDAATAALPDLLGGLNTANGAAQWASIALPPGWGTFPGSTDAITTRLIYKNANVEPIGAPLFCNDASFVNARAPLAQVFRSRTTGGKVIVSINHFKSKNCGMDASAATGTEADQNDGQSCWAPSRLAQAQALIACVGQWQTTAGENRALLLGDFNAYEQENAIDAFRAAGLVPLINNSYSFVFDNASGSLDHAIATPQLVPQITGAEKWHINADEPTSLDYNTEFKTVTQQASLYAPDPFRSSDHDPALVGMTLVSDPALVTITSVTSGAVFGQPVNVAVSVAGVGTPTGTVNITIGGATCVVTLSAGAGNCNLSGVPVGIGQTVAAAYAGDATNSAGNATSTADVAKANTATTITAHTPDPSIVNSPVLVTVTTLPVAPGAGAPSGTITVSDGATNCTITLPANNCSLTPSTVGNKTITATYVGDGNFNASSASGVSQNVIAAPAAPVFTNVSPPPASNANSVYNYVFTAAGDAPITFSVTAGTLPPGLTLSAAGVLSGTPTAPGTYTFTVTASNGVLPNATQVVTIVIAAAPIAVDAVPVPTLSHGMLGLLVLMFGFAAMRAANVAKSANAPL